jgi:hypothetical protein
VQKLSVASVTTHDKWNPKDAAQGYDIALVRLSTPALLATVVESISVLHFS